MDRRWLYIFPPQLCGLDEELGVMVHRFDPGACVCRCGERIVRRPVKKQRAGVYGRMANGTMKWGSSSNKKCLTS